MSTAKKNNIQYKSGLAIVERGGFYHIHMDTPAGRENNFENEAPLCVTDKLELPEDIRAYSLLVQSDKTRRNLREAIVDAVSAMGAGRFDTLDREQLLAYGKRAINAALEVANELVPSYAVICFDCDTDSEDIVIKTRTLNDAIAWAAMRVQNECMVILNDEGCFTYRVYPLNHQGEIDENAPVLYETQSYAK